jgi:hypothetical protein
MGDVNWAAAVDGLFDNVIGWTGGLVPNQLSNVFLDVAGPAFTVLAESGLLDDSDIVINTLQTSTNATLKIVGGDSLISDLLGIATNFTDLAGTGLGANLGKIVIENSLINNVLGTLTASPATLVLNGVFDNVGSIAVAAEPGLLSVLGDAQAVLSVNTFVKLVGSGEVKMLTNTLDDVITGTGLSSTLYNVNNTIIGAGLLGDGKLKLVNGLAGVINSTSSKVALIIDTASNKIINDGLIKNSGFGGTLVKSNIENNGTLANTKGVMTVDGSVTGKGAATISGGKIDFLSNFSQDVTFGKSGVLELAKSTHYTGAISDFSKTGGTALDLSDIAYGKGTRTSYSGNSKGGVLTVTDGSHTSHIDMVGNYLGETFKAVSDGSGGTKVVAEVAKTSAAAQHAFVAAMSSFGATPAVSVNSHDGHGLVRNAMIALPNAHDA